jgi:23S rRNA pseudouridine2604 synthase
MPAPIRLDKCVAALANCSRKDAQQYIEGGWVRVDGVVVEEPQVLAAPERVTLAADAQLGPIQPTTLLLHKPAGMQTEQALALVTPASMSELDTEAPLLKHHLRRLNPLMPLEEAASGLLVLSQDGRVIRRLTEDADTIEQEFVVEVRGDLRPYGLNRLADGMKYQQRMLPPCKVSWQSEDRLRFAIKQVRPGQLQAMCAEVGLQVLGIRRLRIGSVPLGKMAVGQWRRLPAGVRF